jgi:hypothetical protein
MDFWPKINIQATQKSWQSQKTYTGGPPLVRSPLVRIPLVRILVLLGTKFVLVEFVISKLVEFSLCTTQLVRISHTMLGQKSI